MEYCLYSAIAESFANAVAGFDLITYAATRGSLTPQRPVEALFEQILRCSRSSEECSEFPHALIRTRKLIDYGAPRPGNRHRRAQNEHCFMKRPECLNAAQET